MEKIININLQGRVIPIEETAYNSLKQYIESLRNHFANEEGREEIISDIENRIAELLSYKLKQGASCINNTDLTAIINSIGRLEDIQAADGEESKTAQAEAPQPESIPYPKGRFFRNADDKVIAGVCSGLASRLGIDPAIMRVLFVLLFGALFWIYILLWIIVPSQSIRTNVTRRLYRNPDDKVIAGVCGGLAVYFRMSSWSVRLIFTLPLLIGIFSRGLLMMWWHWHPWGPRFFMGSLGSSLFILYVILWIALPYARTATDKLEMRGEKIDMNSIKAANQARTNTPPATSGFLRVIGILFKAFFLFIAGSLALSFFGVLIGLVFTGFVAIPFTNFLLDGWGQSTLAWCGIVLVLGIPLLAFITWGVRRLTGVRSHRHYLGYIFAGLWIVGIISVAALLGTVIKDFSARSAVEDTYNMRQPSGNKLYVNVSNRDYAGMHSHWGWYEARDNNVFRLIGNDSLWLNTVKVRVVQSKDSLFHIYETRFSRGENPANAKMLASHIGFDIAQQDSNITLPDGFAISNKDKFRNQQVLVTIEAPIGKEVQVSDDVDDYTWFNIHADGKSIYYERDFDNHFRRHWRHMGDDDDDKIGGNYIITAGGTKHITPKDTTSSDDSDDNDN